MARTTITHVIDDLDGSRDAHEVSFAFDGAEYTIDLSKKNKAALEKALRPYLDAASKVSRPRGRRPGSLAAKRDVAAVRAWAKAEGIEVSDRGRIPASVVEQYNAAH